MLLRLLGFLGIEGLGQFEFLGIEGSRVFRVLGCGGFRVSRALGCRGFRVGFRSSGTPSCGTRQLLKYL